MTPQNSEFSVQEFLDQYLKLNLTQRLCLRLFLKDKVKQVVIFRVLNLKSQSQVSQVVSSACKKLGMVKPRGRYDPVGEKRWNEQLAVLFEAMDLASLTPEEAEIIDRVRQLIQQGTNIKMTPEEYGKEVSSIEQETSDNQLDVTPAPQESLLAEQPAPEVDIIPTDTSDSEPTESEPAAITTPSVPPTPQSEPIDSKPDTTETQATPPLEQIDPELDNNTSEPNKSDQENSGTPNSTTEPITTEPVSASMSDSTPPPAPEPIETEMATTPPPEPQQPEPTNQTAPPSPIVDVIRAKQAAGEVGQGRISVDRRRLLLLVGAAGLIAVGGFLLGRLMPNQQPAVVANLTPEPTQTPIVVTATPRPTLAFRPTRVRTATATRPTPTSQPTSTPNVEAPTVLPEAAATITPEALIVSNPGPTATPELQTPTPTVPPTPTPEPIQVGNLLVPFEDAFDQSWRSEWDASGGRLSVVNGRLTSAADAPFVLWLGDEQLTDYTVEFDYQAGWGIDLYVGPYFRWVDRFGNTTNGFSPRQWQERQPNTNQWSKRSTDFFNMGSGRFKLVVSGDTYTLSVNNGEKIVYTLSGINPKGPFGIGMQQDTFIDNFKLTVP